MRLATFVTHAASGDPRIGAAVRGQLLDIAAAERIEGRTSALAFASLKALLAAGPDALGRVRRVVDACGADPTRFAAALHDEGAVRFLPTIPDAEKLLCVGKNYRSHLEELRQHDLIKETPGEPTGFIKLNASLVGHGGDIVRPRTVTHLDYEPELVFVIGRDAYEVGEANAFDYVAGITMLNDLTCRDTQKREVASGSRFWTAKNAPGFGPLGPYLITMDEVGDPYDLWVTCSVNGEQRMRVNPSEQIWKLPRSLAHFSRLVPIRAGDMFSTGAPGGVAVGKPNAEALFLQPGDVVECAFEKPAMVLRNRIVAPPRSR